MQAPHCRIIASVFHDDTAGKAPRPVIPAGRSVPRRLSGLSRAVVACATGLLAAHPQDTEVLPVVFSSRFSELYRTLQLLREWREFGDMSPAGFSLSVHNAPVSVLSQAIGGHGSFCAMAAGKDSLRMGMMDAGLMAERKGRCLFVYADAISHGAEECQVCALLLEAAEEQIPLPRTLAELKQLCHAPQP